MVGGSTPGNVIPMYAGVPTKGWVLAKEQGAIGWCGLARPHWVFIKVVRYISN